MKEYVIYIRNGLGTPYFTNIYNSFESAKDRLNSIIAIEEERSRPFYVDNDFFDNIYNYSEKTKYFCIKVRNVEEWEKYSENNFVNYNNKKIIYLNNHRI